MSRIYFKGKYVRKCLLFVVGWEEGDARRLFRKLQTEEYDPFPLLPGRPSFSRYLQVVPYKRLKTMENR